MGKSRKSIRLAAVLVVAAATAAAFAYRAPLSRWAFAQRIVRMDGPNEGQLDRVFAEQGASADALLLLWSSHRMPHRHRVMHTIQEHAKLTQDHWPELRPLVLDAVASRDMDLVEPGMGALCRNDPQLAKSAAIALLQDADPEMRIIGVRSIQQLRDPGAYRALFACLGDPERSVQLRAKLAIAALGQPIDDVTLRDPQSVQQGIERLEKTLSPGQAAITPLNETTTAIAAPDFTANDLDDHPVHLADLRGKPVLLNFWATWCGPCRDEIPALAALQQAHPELKIVGISVDSVKEDDGDGGEDPATVLPAIRKALSDDHVPYTDVLDRTGSMVAKYDGSGVPLTVLIDAQGIVRRRYVGGRSLAAMEKMLASLPPSVSPPAAERR